MTSDDLLIRARRLETDALVQIHNLYYPELYRYVRYRLEDTQVCEDITADVFLRLLDALDNGRGPNRKLRGWLFGTASNLVNDYFRQRYAQKIDPVSVDDVILVADENPESELDKTSKHRRVRKAISELTAEQQHVLALRFSDERSLQETADIMGKSVSAVKALQFRAIAALQRKLTE
jgi:RNA polymerase sigma-70 factor (ECF subfamily)